LALTVWVTRAGQLESLQATGGWLIHKPGKAESDPLHGRYFVALPPSEGTRGQKQAVVEYEPDTDLRDTEQIPLLEPGGIEAFFRREVAPYVPDAWIDPDPKATKIGYEVSFPRHFYQPQPLRSLDEIRADIKALETETKRLLEEVVGGNTRSVLSAPNHHSKPKAPARS
jgi:type I restriction enzyme M protein